MLPETSRFGTSKERISERRRDVYYQVGRRPEKIAKKVEKLREAKVTTLRKVLLARSCATENPLLGGDPSP